MEEATQQVEITMVIMALLLIALLITAFLLRWKIDEMQKLQKSLKESNKGLYEYASQFLSLCSIYKDRLNKINLTIQRKINTGQVDELLKLSKSGKLLAESNQEFNRTIDESFLRLHPNFVNDVNKLLQDDKQVEHEENNLLSVQLRIMVLICMGVESGAEMSNLLGVSLNTIYAYRSRMKCAAKNPETFEEDVKRLGIQH